jgi:hypothetical protein
MPTKAEIEAGIAVAGYTPRDTVINILEAAEAARAGKPVARSYKWPDRITSAKTECAHAKCPDQSACRKGCIHQQPITWASDPTVQ